MTLQVENLSLNLGLFSLDNISLNLPTGKTAGFRDFEIFNCPIQDLT